MPVGFPGYKERNYPKYITQTDYYLGLIISVFRNFSFYRLRIYHKY
jgi:hypothetical protein